MTRISTGGGGGHFWKPDFLGPTTTGWDILKFLSGGHLQRGRTIRIFLNVIKCPPYFSYIHIHNTYIHTCIYMYMYACMYVCMYVCMYACMHVYICMYKCMDVLAICIYVYACTYVFM